VGNNKIITLGNFEILLRITVMFGDGEMGGRGDLSTGGGMERKHANNCVCTKKAPDF
jgi:hypothetical protein